MGKTSKNNPAFSPGYVINPAQLGGIDLVSQLDGPGVGTRSAWVNTGSGLHYKVLIDRGLDIAEAFYKGLSLCWLSLAGAPKPEMSLNRGIEWLWGFPGGLLVSCGPSFVGAPCEDSGEQLSLHGRHSNLRASLESVILPDPIRNVGEMSITGIVREARLFNPNLELRRTIRSPLGKSLIVIEDTFINRGNETTDHAWLLHINLGYPLLEPGSQFVFSGKVSPRADSVEYYKKRNFRVVPEPLDAHRGRGEAAAYIDPDTDGEGRVRCGVINPKRKIGLRISFAKKDFPRFVNWQHWGPNGQFVMGIEPANCGVEGRPRDRERGWLDRLKPGQVKKYCCTIEVLEDPIELAAFRKSSGK
jgi:hypothetical protein